MPVQSLGVSVQIRECLQASDSLPLDEDEEEDAEEGEGDQGVPPKERWQ